MDTQRTAGANRDPGYVAELSCALSGGGEGACEEGDEGDVNTQDEEEQDDEVVGGQPRLSAAALLTQHPGRNDGSAYPEDGEEKRFPTPAFFYHCCSICVSCWGRGVLSSSIS